MYKLNDIINIINNEYNKAITENMKELLYAVYNEFENEIGDYNSDYKEELDDKDIDILLEFLRKFIDKVELCMDDEFKN